MDELVLVQKHVHKDLANLGKNNKSKPEIGGILIGTYRGPHVEVLDYTLPGPRDRSKMFRFIKQDRIHQRQALRAWKKSKQTQTYIGEWHSHPHGAASPSSVDIQTWQNIVGQTKASMVFCIVTPSDVGWFKLKYEARRGRPCPIHTLNLGQDFIFEG